MTIIKLKLESLAKAGRLLAKVKSHARRVFGIDPRSLGLFRICFGLTLVSDLVQQSAILGEMTTDAGSLPRALHAQLYSPVQRWSLHLLGGSWGFEAFLYALTFAALGAFILGYRTRWATLALWVLLASLHNRHPMFNTASDSVRCLMLFWGFFLPLGCRFSLDRRSGRDTTPAEPIFSAASVAILLQVVMIYLCAGLQKDYDTWVRQGTATIMALRLDIFATRFGKALLEYPLLLKATSRYTWWVEAVMPFVALSPIYNGWARLLAVAAFVGLHAGLYLCMELGAFPYLMMAVWMIFLPPLWWSWLKTLPERSGFVGRFGARVGKLLAAARGNRSDVSGHKGGGRRWTDSLQAQTFVAVVLFAVVLWNVQTVGRRFSHDFPQLVRSKVVDVMSVLKLKQYWGVFAPHPFRQDGWLMVVATLQDGSKVDLFRGGRPVDFTKPEHVGDIYTNPRWRKYTHNLVSRQGKKHRLAYAEMHVRRWNANKPESRRVKQVEIIRMVEMTRTDLTEAPPHKELIWKGSF